MIYIDARPGENLRIGQQGENGAVTVRFFVKHWIEQYGDGDFTVLNKRTEDIDAYPCAVTSDENFVYWVLTSADTQYRGKGECQLVYTVNGVVTKTEVYRTEVSKSLNGSGNVPEAWKGWVDKVYDQLNMLRLESMKLQKLTDFGHYIEFEDWNYDTGRRYIDKLMPQPSSCSALRNGRWFGRTFDYNYDNIAEFVIRTAASRGRHASIGIARGMPEMTEDAANSGEWIDAIGAIPFLTQDGINDAHVACEINLVPAGDKGFTTGTKDGAEKLCVLMLVRYVLDYADSAAHAIDIIKNNISWWAPHTDDLTQECHFLIADRNSTYVVEFVENEIVVFSDADDEYPPIPNDKAILTNFYYDGWDGNIVTGFERGGILPEETTLTSHAMGTERYEILSDGFETAVSMIGTKDLMKSVKYTKTYDETNGWYSEMTGDHGDPYGDMTIYQKKEDYSQIMAYAAELFANRTRDGKTWQTNHTTVIDIEDMNLYVCFQEDYSHSFGFSVKQLGNTDVPKTAEDVMFDDDAEYSVNTVGNKLQSVVADLLDDAEHLVFIDNYITITPEEYEINNWERMLGTDAEPYTYKAEVTAEYPIGEDTKVELINNNAVLFAKYGFSIASVDGQKLTIYALDIPYDTVTLRVEYMR